MNDPAWCQSEVARQSELVRELTRHLNLAAQARDDVARAWDDRAGKDIASRFLEPFKKDVEESNSFLNAQVDSLSEAVHAMKQAEIPSRGIAELLVEAQVLRGQIDKEVQSAESASTVSFDAIAAVKLNVRETEKLLNQIGS
jgi:hypothetical protein